MKGKTDGSNLSEFDSRHVKLKSSALQKGSLRKNTKQNIESYDHFLSAGQCLIDLASRQFACSQRNCNSQSNCFMQDIVDYNTGIQLLKLHPDDSDIWCRQVFLDIMTILYSLPPEIYQQCRLLFNHRYIREDGSVSQFLHEGIFIDSNDDAKPQIKLKTFTELGDFKTDEKMILSVLRYTPEHGYQKIYSKEYPETGIQLISHREIEIIKLCLEGNSSKMIADKLNISIHTVKNHKRNCMDKTQTHSITELINCCLKNKWI